MRNAVYQTSHLSFISVESSRMEPSVNMMDIGTANSTHSTFDHFFFSLLMFFG